MSIASNLDLVRSRISEAERRSGRTEGSTALIAVSKFNPAGTVLEALAAGQTLFGENRVQEATGKFEEITRQHPDTIVHMIGSLQRNKVHSAISLFDCIQSVDRPELLTEIGKQCQAAGKQIDVLFELHTGEESKSGYSDLDSLLRSIDMLASLDHVTCAGLMTMAPFTTDQALIRHSFRMLVAAQRECIRRYPELDFSVLSMGMSSDFEIAIEEGSTLVRVGTAIFGSRS